MACSSKCRWENKAVLSEEPPAMSHTPRLYMTSTAVHSSAPMMLTFETSGGDVGQSRTACSDARAPERTQ
eukprot:1746351-Amphidinium_carterae.1